jgi:uncharacterized membrane protein YcaP (DUF421 family)
MWHRGFPGHQRTTMNTAFRSLYLPDIPTWSLVLRAIVVYGAVLLLLRVAGKRQVAQLGISDFVALLLISNAVQNSMNGGDNSLLGGILLAGVLILLSYFFQYATFRSRKLEHLIQGRPTLLVHHGKILQEHLNRELMTVRELKSILRKQGVELCDISEAILESDGYVSVIKKEECEDPMEMVRNDVY